MRIFYLSFIALLGLTSEAVQGQEGSATPTRKVTPV